MERTSKVVIFVRHGQCESNAADIYQGGDQVTCDALTELGVEQAKKAAEYLFGRFPYEAIVSSSALRAVQTAKLINEKRQVPHLIPLATKQKGVWFDVEPDDEDLIKAVPSLLREIDNPSELAGLHKDDPKADILKKKLSRIHSIALRSLTFKQHYADEENMYDQWRRAKLIVDYIEQRPEKRLVVVSHGGTIKLTYANIIERHKNADQSLLTRLRSPLEMRNELRSFQGDKITLWLGNAEIIAMRFNANEGWQVPIGSIQHLHPDEEIVGNLRLRTHDESEELPSDKSGDYSS